MTNNDDKKPPSDSWCETDLKAAKMSKNGIFIWKISGFMGQRNNFENCRFVKNVGQFLHSQSFMAIKIKILH